jgi:hypothetical protein
LISFIIFKIKIGLSDSENICQKGTINIPLFSTKLEFARLWKKDFKDFFYANDADNVTGLGFFKPVLFTI